MKKSEQLQQKIIELTKERNKALLDETKICIWKDSCRFPVGKRIGCWNIGKMEVIMQYLDKGEICLMEHCALGNWVFVMNPQKNRISVAPFDRDPKPFSVNVNEQEPVYEDNALHMMAYATADWYVLDGKSREIARDRLYPF